MPFVWERRAGARKSPSSTSSSPPSSSSSASSASNTSLLSTSSRGVSGSVIRSGALVTCGEAISLVYSVLPPGGNIAAVAESSCAGCRTAMTEFTIAIIPRSLRETYRQNQLPDSVWPRGQHSQAEPSSMLALYDTSPFFVLLLLL